jgi:hypothetical protein
VPTVTDDFNRANGSLNGSTPSGGGAATWATDTEWTVTTNRARCAGTSGRKLARIDCGSKDVTFEATYVTRGNNGGVLLRYDDASNFWFAYLISNYIHICKVQGGTLSDPAFAGWNNDGVATAEGDSWRITCEDTGGQTHIKLERKPAAGSYSTILDKTTTGGALFSGTSHGFYRDNAGTCEWDDLTITPIVVTTLTIDRDNVLCGSGTVTVNLTGVGTSWTGTPFSLTGAPTGWSISSQNVISGTSATVTLNKGSGTGAFSITDGTLSDSVTATNTATSAATGSWGTAATWNVIEVPVSGNRAVVSSGHTITVAANATIGDSPADATTWVLDVEGTLTVNAGIVLTVKGNARVRTFNGGDSSTGGGALEIDGSTSSTAHVLQMGTATNQTANRFTLRGITTGTGISRNTSLNFVVRSNGGGPNAKITSLQNSGFFDCEDGYFLRFGTTAVNGLGTSYDTADYDQKFHRCTFDACGRTNWDLSVGADGGWTLQHTYFINVLTGGGACFRPLATGAKNAGTVREVKWCIFDCPTINEVPNLQVTSNTIEDCALRNGIGGTQTPAAWTRGILYYDDGASARSGSALLSDQTDVYVCTNSDHASGNAHMLLVNQNRTYALTGTQFDNTMVAGEDTSDLYYGAQSLTQTVTITRMIIGKNPVTGSGAGVINPNSPDWRIRHCSAWANGAVVMLGDLDLAAGTVTEFKSNAVKGVASEHLLRYVHHNADPSSSAAPNVLTAAGATHNASTGLSAGQEGGGYNTYNTDGTPGSNDLFGTDPEWFDGTRNMGSWAVSRGYSAEGMGSAASIRAAYDDAWEAIKTDPARMADLYEWRQDGFAPINTDLEDAGHDAVTIGAVAMKTPQAGRPGLRTGGSLSAVGILTGGLM